jgi:hypothetical protein
LLSFLALIDPVGSKHADDSDPFGPPDGRAYPAVVMVIGIALVLWPVVPLARLSGKKAATHPGQRSLSDRGRSSR